MSDDAFSVVLRGIRKSYGSQQVLRGVDLQVSRGTVFALLGENGAGKTTTLSILTTLLTPDAGTAQVAGFDVVRDPAQVRQAITVIGQNVTVDPILTGFENLVLIGRLRHVGKPKQIAADLVERFGLGEAARKATGSYSGGMKRRLDIAMSLIGEPQVVFLDEPTTGLDPAGRREVWAAIGQLAERGATVMLTTQYMEEAARLAGTIGLLHGGVIALEGDEAAIRRAAGDAPDLETAFLALTGQEVAP
ncbi:MAG: ATP-binding cassette domain-containing protein [Bifidobacteriaceae bacterium]|jgi:ABC-2 type transport system ATP-binding protein|nr:ATP-binding cassette domain-containing protein [Bifidobacteriaceae bacterium]